jgi:signal transduction histidine kinase
MTGTAQDISERKQIEEELRTSREQLRQLSSYLQAAREEERTRISREIHDQFGGALMALKMDLWQLQRYMTARSSDAEANAALQERVNAMAGLIDGMAQNIRRIAADLRPGILDDLGLEAAIEWQLQEFETRSGIRCELVSKIGDLRLDPDGSTALFRVFQETLTNVARHAQATHVEVYLDEQTDQLVLQVRDNGRGISEQDMAGANSLGLVGMRERIRLLAGDLNIHGVPGQGTTILARVPLHRNRAA